MTAYTLHSQGSYGLAPSGDGGSFVLGTQFSVSTSVSLTGIWFFSGASAAALPSRCGIWNIATAAEVAGTDNTSPSWSGAAGSGWVKCPYSGAVTLVPSVNYVTSAFLAGGPLNWFYDVSGFWTSGGGSAGITNGPLSAPPSSGAVNGQAVFNGGGGWNLPVSTVSGFDFGVDVEVSTISAPPAIAPVLISQFSGLY